MARIAAMLVLANLCGCAAQGTNCLLPSERHLTVVELFFGRNIPGRAPLLEHEWQNFVASIIAKEFPQGFTVADGEGEWRDPATQAVEQERSKILTVAVQQWPDLGSRLARIRDAYAKLYGQTSVGLLTYEACGEF